MSSHCAIYSHLYSLIKHTFKGVESLLDDSSPVLETFMLVFDWQLVARINKALSESHCSFMGVVAVSFDQHQVCQW